MTHLVCTCEFETAEEWNSQQFVYLKKKTSVGTGLDCAHKFLYARCTGVERVKTIKNSVYERTGVAACSLDFHKIL